MTAVRKRRSWLVSLCGVVFIVGGALLSVISFFAFLMIIAGSHGTASTTVSDFLSVVVAPPAAVVVGIGLILRRRWAWLCAVLGLPVAMGSGLLAAWPSDPTATGFGGGWDLPLVVFASGCLLGILLLPRARGEFAGGVAAGDRTDVAVAAAAMGPAEPAAPLPAPERDERPAKAAGGQGSTAVLAAVVLILLAIAGLVAWRIVEALGTGSVWLPGGRGAHWFEALRAGEPWQFWVGIGLHGLVAAGCAGLALWMLAPAGGSMFRRP